MEATEVLYTTSANAMKALSTEMSLTPTLQLLQQQQQQQQQQQHTTPLSPLPTAIITPTIAATTPRTATHTPREIPSMYILDQLYDDYMDQCTGNNISTPTEVPETNASTTLAPCPICSRTFNPVTLKKHVGICEKMAVKKRNKFDSSRQRREGTELATYPLPKNFGLPEKTTSTTSVTPARNERGQSPKPAVQQVSSPIATRKKPVEDLTRSTARASMRKTAAATHSSTTPAAGAAASNSSSNFNRDRMRSSDRSLTRRGIQPLPAEQCPHCERCFGIKAYDRHVEWCKEKALLASIKHGTSKNEGNVAKARLEARIKYRAPCLKTKRSLNREKYSGLGGEEQEMEDTSRCSKTSHNKTPDNSVMSMSMTSSICSERKITNSTTGNINEPVAAAKVHKKPHFPVEKLQLPTTTTTEEEQQTEEPLVNMEMQLPEFYLQGEQMTTSSINKIQPAKIAKAAKIKLRKQKQLQEQQEQQQQQLMDVQINPSSITPKLQQKKSASDLSLKSSTSCNNPCLPQTYEALEIVNDNHEDLEYHDSNIVSGRNVANFPANEAPVEMADLSKCLNLKNSKAHERRLAKMALEAKRKQMEIESNNKLTMKEYFDQEERDDFSTNCSSFRSKYSDENRFQNSAYDSHRSQISQDLPQADLHVQENQYQDFVMKQSYSKRLDDFTNDYDSEEFEKSDVSTNSLIDIAKSPSTRHAKEKSPSKTLRKQTGKQNVYKTELKETETNTTRKCAELEANISVTTKMSSPNLLKQTREYSKSKESHLELETYKDCLTDSDELRRQRNASQEILNTRDNIKSTPEKKLLDLPAKKELKTLKAPTKSDTFVKDRNENSSNSLEFEEDNYEEYTHSQRSIKMTKSSQDLSCPKTNHRDYSPARPRVNEVSQHNDTARRQARNSTPPPQVASQTPRTPNNETSRIKSLINICQPKRKKVLRQTASCPNTLPMKALMPMSMENLKICGVTSAPQIQNDSKSVNAMPSAGDDVEQFKDIEMGNEVVENTCVWDKDIRVIKEPPQLKRNRSFTVIGLPDNYDPFLSAKRQLEELCSPSTDAVDLTTTPQTPQLLNMPTTPTSNSKMSTSLILSSSTSNTTPNLMTTSQIPAQQTQKTPILVRSSSFRRTSSLRGPRRSPMLTSRPPFFAQKHRPTIQRGLSDEGPISTNFLKPEEYDEMPVRSVCVNDFAVNKSPRVVRRDTSTSNRKQPLKLNINTANANSSSSHASPNILQPPLVANNSTATKYVSKTDSLAVFLKFEHDLENLNAASTNSDHKLDIKPPATTSATPLSNLDSPLNAKELKDKSNNLSKQNSAKNIKAEDGAANNDKNLNTTSQLATAELETIKYGQVRLAPMTTKPSTPSTKPATPQLQPQQPLTSQLTPLNVNISLVQNQEQTTHKSPKLVALSSIFGSDNRNTKPTSLLYTESKTPLVGSDYIDPKLINKCDNLPINLNLKQRTDFKHSDSDTSESRLQQFSSSSSESSAVAKKTTSQPQHTKFLPTVKPQHQPPQQQHKHNEQINDLYSTKTNPNQAPPQQLPLSVTSSQRNSAEGRNLLKRRMRLGRNQFLYDASPEGDSCSADDEGANRSSMEGDASQRHYSSSKHREKTFEHLSSDQINPIDAPFIPPMPAFDDFDFEEFLSSFENDEEQFPLFKDCREFLMNRTAKKERSVTQNNNTTSHNNSMNFNKSSSPKTFPPLTPQSLSNAGQHFQFPTLSQHPKNLFNSFSLNTRSRNKFDELTSTKSTDTFCVNSHAEEYEELDDQNLNHKREIFISIETEQNDLDKSSISPTSIRNMVGNPQTVVEVEVDAAHDNKFSKISDDDGDAETTQSKCRSKNFSGHSGSKHLPNVQLNNAKNLMQQDFRQMGEEMSGNQRVTREPRTAPVDVNLNRSSTMPENERNMVKMNQAAGTLSSDVHGDSDELSSLEGYPLSSPNYRLGVSSKTSADSAYGSLSRQRSSELISQRSSSCNRRTITSNTTNTLLNRTLTEETSLSRASPLSASSTSSSEQALPPITSSSSYHKQQHKQQQQQQLLTNNNNNNNIANDDMMAYEFNNNYDVQRTHPNLTGTTNSHSNLESLQQYTSNSTMSTSMRMSKFCHECGSKFLLEQAKFCMDCGVKRLLL